MRRSHNPTSLRKRSLHSSQHLLDLQAAAVKAVKKDIRKSAPPRLGTAGREWLQTCLDCLRHIAGSGVLRRTLGEDGLR